MSKHKADQVSDFGEAALALDHEFVRMERLARDLDHLAIDSDKGMERADVLLAEVEISRERMATNMQVMVQALENARRRNEEAEKLIADRTAQFQARQKVAGDIIERFRALAEMVRQLTAANLSFLNAKAGSLSPEDRSALNEHLPQLTEQLGILVEEANKLMTASRDANMKSLERNSDSLRQSLQALKNRLVLLAGEPSASGPQ